MIVARLADRLGTNGTGKDDWVSDTVGLAFCVGSEVDSCDCGVAMARSPRCCVELSEDAAAAACCSAISFREALPRFLRSRRYAQVKPNSGEALV